MSFSVMTKVYKIKNLVIGPHLQCSGKHTLLHGLYIYYFYTLQTNQKTKSTYYSVNLKDKEAQKH